MRRGLLDRPIEKRRSDGIDLLRVALAPIVEAREAVRLQPQWPAARKTLDDLSNATLQHR